MKQLQKKQRDEIVAILSDDQKQELAKVEAAASTASKSKSANAGAEAAESKKD
jgi:hypothetical protein